MDFHVDVNALFQSASALFGAVLLLMLRSGYAKMKEHWSKQDQLQNLQSIKIDSIVYAMGNVKDGVGQKFTEFYEQKYNELVRENNFINNKRQ